MKSYKRVLTIAGSDSGGGAGIQADLKTFAALGCYGMSVITALTAQNTQSVTAISSVSDDFVVAQLEAVLTDIGTDAVKIGMIHRADIIEAIAETLQGYRVRNIVLDPVMVAKSGDKLLQDEAIESLKRYLLPIATVITPNLPEAAVLTGKNIQDITEMKESVIELAQLTQGYILLKGGHLEGNESVDILYHAQTDQLSTLTSERVHTVNSHGTGCTLSSAIAAGLANGLSVSEAVVAAKEYLTNALKAGAEYTLGSGHGPVHHFFSYWS
ncbi:bifunctional hydroxymethylpyrimidine kinase/phosphomethylpyrimidine kinase [Cytophagaceae bacterium YF14B1]|uniref:hydroxymethylpyrimidine kinase n=1 Tax=Xanthocytophaga flava TaxID=3048013 RepID=A0AAE3U8F3_9BACT|nr:bifunctional hydroxymethylpyrimidine kinase/phosphomethylpyrimidine kinase [Xanthocytophaga flavus]MDJ1483959.1 bifunctional hydroxymethylpyrimidine kinase/phosphomethylpyrimidine kinase [Xanthocytophaga flavus]